MKSIINGLLYDTNKATLLHYENSSFTAIYITPNGRLFMTDCESITCTDQGECKEYLGRVFPDRYIELFGEVGEA